MRTFLMAVVAFGAMPRTAHTRPLRNQREPALTDGYDSSTYRHATYGSLPIYPGDGYGPYHAGSYQPSYGGPPGRAGGARKPPTHRRLHLGIGPYFAQLERDDGLVVGMAGISLRWRGRVFEGELGLGRRVDVDGDFVERLGATLYANLGAPDALHPYLLAGVGLLDTHRLFGAVGAGLALPLAPRLTVAGDARASSISTRLHPGDTRMLDAARYRTVEGRLSLVVDF